MFISRWKVSGASERANYQLFLTELCELIGVEKPRPASDKVHEATYTFERPVEFDDGEGRRTTNFIDLYKQHCFVLEAKQGADKTVISEAELLGGDKIKTKTGSATRDTRNWDREMKRAKEQALRYARSLPPSEGWPPFLVVVDVGFCIDLYSDFARQGKTYIPFPGPLDYRILLADLEKEEIRGRLRLLFSDPLELDPSKRAAKVTSDLAKRLARLAVLLEQSGNTPEKVAGFLMRCLFTMFAEDVHLLPERSFTKLLQDYKNNLQHLPNALKSLWISMDKGGFDAALHMTIPQFNGFLYKEQEALFLTEAQLDLLILASEADWADVEPAIFGTLLERALEPRERHKLGAHYTPRAYVERLVMPTVIEPLREEWEAARTASAILENNGDDVNALKEIVKFQRRLCSVKVLDPACGSGNFLYVTLEHLKRLEGEVGEYIAHFPRQLGLDMTGGYTVTPAQFLGLEVNPRAAAIADVVLWIGYLQWHFKTYGHAKRLEDPILRQYGNIIQQDALLSYTSKNLRLDNIGNPVARWDGETTKLHPITGNKVPDETALTSVYDYIDPKPAIWPEADFIVGNPPFVGNKRMREVLSDGYTEALRLVYKGYVPESADLVMFWWHKAAKLLAGGKITRFGFITTNSITQSFNRRILQDALNSASNPISIIYAIPDHPWVDSYEGAAVRIAMSIAEKKIHSGRIDLVIEETENGEFGQKVIFVERFGQIHSDLTVGSDVTSASILKANQSVSSRGVICHGAGFILSVEEAVRIKNQGASAAIIKPYRNGRDINQKNRNVYIIDTFGFSEKDLLLQEPAIYQWLFERVKPGRDINLDKSIRTNWWLYARPRSEFRPALLGLKRYFATVQTSKHRVFTFLDSAIMPDDKLIAFAFEDSFYLGVLSSRIHCEWASATGSRMGVGNDLVYDKTRCFDTFPFPDADENKKNEIREVADHLDAHRKERQSLHPSLTITDMYNVLEKLRSNEILDAKEQKINEQGLVSVQLRLHNELDRAVANAYGWPTNVSEEEILEKLVVLNRERATEEGRGHVRWLRPEYQNRQGGQQTGLQVTTGEETVISPIPGLSDWPKTLSEQAKAVNRIIQQSQHPVSAARINKQFKTTKKPTLTQRKQQIENLLETISMLGLVRKTEAGLYVR
jgi:hypothetical protein